MASRKIKSQNLKIKLLFGVHALVSLFKFHFRIVFEYIYFFWSDRAQNLGPGVSRPGDSENPFRLACFSPNRRQHDGVLTYVLKDTYLAAPPPAGAGVP